MPRREPLPGNRFASFASFPPLQPAVRAARGPRAHPIDTGRPDPRPAVAVVTGKSRSVGADIAMRLVTDSSVAKETLWRFLSQYGSERESGKRWSGGSNAAPR